MRQALKKITPLRRLYYRFQIASAKAQSNEAQIIAALARDCPKTFVEFGFDPTEFNCLALARDPQWSGLLIDGSARKVADVRWLFPERVRVERAFLSLDNLDIVRHSFERIGVLSIDVDGNDYWFLETLIDVKPSVICIEYNASFGQEPITVPYDPEFDRDKMHPRGWYHGASLAALAKLTAAHGYGLAAISEAGTNAFFTRTGTLDPAKAWKPCALRETFSGIGQDGQWASLRDMPFITV
jgi:hypothetical protein